MTLPPALAALEAYPRFIACWAYPDPSRPGKTVKEPLDWLTGRLCDPTNPANQTSYDNVAAFVARVAGTKPGYTYHIGFVFDRADKLFFLDIDGCAEAHSATQPSWGWNAQAVELCNMFPSAAVEVSQSGKGLHIFGRYSGDEPPHAKKNVALGLELYTDKRFVVITGQGTRGDVRADCTGALHQVIAAVFPPNEYADCVGWTSEPVVEYGGPADDAELLKRMLASAGSGAARLGYRATVAELWTRDVEALSKYYPANREEGFDPSSADAALAWHLSFWTGKNCERIRELMFQSALVRPKWDERPEYVEGTIMEMVTRNPGVLGGDRADPTSMVEEGAVSAAQTHNSTISATPYVFRDPATIKPREWIFGSSLLRGSLSIIVAPGAAGKTALTVAMALSLCTGRNFLGKPVYGGAKRVWLWNLEDGGDELARSIQACARHWGISPIEFGERLFVDSGLDGEGLTLATQNRTGFDKNLTAIEELTTELKSQAIDVLIIDPFVSSHQVSENDNGAIDAIAKAFAKIAVEANCAVLLVHHSRKLGNEENTADAARGASALVNAARSVLTLNRMSEQDGRKFGLEGDAYRRYFRVFDDKNNRAPPAETSDWYRRESVQLGNGANGSEGDSLPVVVPWHPPDTRLDVSDEDLHRVQSAISEGEWRDNIQANDWAGVAVAQVLGLNPATETDKARIKALLKSWKDDGFLKIERRKDDKANSRPFITVGRWVNAQTSSPDKSGVI